MRILAFDISSVHTGVSVCQDGYIDLSSVCTIDPSVKYSLGQKLLYFEKAVKRLIKKHTPDEIIVEDIFIGFNPKSFKVLAMFRGVAIKTIQEKTGKDPHSLMPTEARRIVGIRYKKEEAFADATKLFGLKDWDFTKTNDMVDSIVLGMALYRLLTGQATLSVKPTKRKRKSK
jgi:Holliday junction resolvasome RuvABC endonuclease subunit